MYLTIAIAIYNGEKYIDRCLMSIKKALENCNKNFELEILAINDGSKDNSLEILNKYSNQFKNFVIINKENGGISSVRNCAIQNAKGQFLWIIDVDDEVTYNSLNDIKDNLLSDINMFDYIQIMNDSVIKNNYNLDYGLFSIMSKKELITFSGSTWKFIFSAKLLRNSNIQFLKNLIYEDLNFTAKLFLFAQNINIVNKSIYKYYINDNSIMTSKNLDKKKDILFVLDDVYNYYKNNKALDLYNDELEYLFIHHILYVAYVSVVQIDSNSKLLKLFIDAVESKYPNWESNKYLTQQSIIKKTILKFIKKDNRKVVVILLKLKEFFKKIV